MKRVLTIFSQPVFPEDEDKTRKARLANVIALVFMAIALAFEAVAMNTRAITFASLALRVLSSSSGKTV